MTANVSMQTERVAYGRLWWVGLLAVILSLVANAVVRTIAAMAFNVSPEFTPFTWGQFIVLDVAGVIGAVIAFAIVGKFSGRPIRAFRRISVVALILSWLPDFGLLAASPYPGTTVQAVGSLMFMHVVAAAISVGLLTTLGREK